MGLFEGEVIKRLKHLGFIMSMFGDEVSNGLEDSHFMSNVRFVFHESVMQFNFSIRNIMLSISEIATLVYASL